MASSATPQSPGVTKNEVNNLKSEIAKLQSALKNSINQQRAIAKNAAKKQNNYENTLYRLKKSLKKREYYNNNDYHRRHTGRSTYKLREGETGYFNSKLRRFFYNPDIGLYVKVFNPRTGKLTSVPRRGIFVYQNVGNKIVKYRTYRPRAAVLRPTSQSARTRENAYLARLKKYQGLVGYSNNEEPRYKYRSSYRR